MEEVMATAFEDRTIDAWLGEEGPEHNIVRLVELTNGRTLVIDDGGIMDLADVDLEKRIPLQHFTYVSWAELLALLDGMRAQEMN